MKLKRYLRTTAATVMMVAGLLLSFPDNTIDPRHILSGMMFAFGLGWMLIELFY